MIPPTDFPSKAAPRARAPLAREPRRGGWSLEWKLPVTITVLLAIVLGVGLMVSYGAIERAAVGQAEARLENGAEALTQLTAPALVATRQAVTAAARSPELRAVTAGDPGDAVRDSSRAEMSRLIPERDTLTTIELWDRSGHRLLAVGQDSASTQLPASDAFAPELAARVAVAPGADTAETLPIHVYQGKRVVSTAAPVVVDGERQGYLVRRRRIAAVPALERTLRGLSGTDISLYFHNADGTGWTTAAGTPVAALVVSGDSGSRRETRPGVGRVLVAERVLDGSPLALVVERPLASVRTGPRRTTRQLALLSLVLLAAGAMAAWLISRGIVRPLTLVTEAAESIAGGDYGARVQVSGRDELARLAAGFNHMAHEVATSREELEAQTEEAQGAAEELDRANRELAEALRAVEERESQLRALADALPQISWMAHADGEVFWYNERFYAYSGISPEQAMVDGWQLLHDPALLPRVLERWRRSIETGQPFEMEMPLRGADGGFRWFLTRMDPVLGVDGRVARWFGTSTDVQGLREAREAADAARAEAERANRAKSEFLAVMSHELRTPLNAIGGYTELLEMGVRGPVTDAQRRDLERIRASQQHLLGLISGVLDLSRIEAGRVAYDLAPVALDPMLAGLDALLEPQAMAKSLVLDYAPCEEQLGAMADREKLRQILLNLLSNAVRYTPAGGRIVLGCHAEGGDTVAITVRDSGIGIAPDALSHIFEPFVQLDRSLTRIRDGVGLGLAISLDLARGMGGDIRVESTPGEGSLFTVTFPRAAVDAQLASSPMSGEYPAVPREA